MTPTEAAVVILALVAAAALIFWDRRRTSRKEKQATLTRIDRLLSRGICPICSHHRFGYAHGYEDSLQAPYHDGCPERLRRS